MKNILLIFISFASLFQNSNAHSVASHSMVDVLFVVDNSGSMHEEQLNLARNFQYFIEEFSKRNINFHVGVISTDAITKQEANKFGQSQLVEYRRKTGNGEALC